MLEDPNTIDIVMHDGNGKVTFVIIDAGVTTDSDKKLELLNHKISVCVGMIADEEKFAELGRPDDITIEVRCAYPINENAPPKHLSTTFDNGREMHCKVVFVRRPMPYGAG